MIAQRLVARLPSSAVRASAASARLAAYTPTAVRAIATSAVRRADGPPVITGEGAKTGEVASDEQQATGLERYELLGKLQGVDVFNMEPLQMTRPGTTSDPIKVESLFPTRIVGCTGYPADSHDNIYLHLTRDLKNHRCPECGNVYSLEFIGDEHAGHH